MADKIQIGSGEQARTGELRERDDGVFSVATEASEGWVFHGTARQNFETGKLEVTSDSGDLVSGTYEKQGDRYVPPVADYPSDNNVTASTSTYRPRTRPESSALRANVVGFYMSSVIGFIVAAGVNFFYLLGTNTKVFELHDARRLEPISRFLYLLLIPHLSSYGLLCSVAKVALLLFILILHFVITLCGWLLIGQILSNIFAKKFNIRTRLIPRWDWVKSGSTRVLWGIPLLLILVGVLVIACGLCEIIAGLVFWKSHDAE